MYNLKFLEDDKTRQRSHGLGLRKLPQTATFLQHSDTRLESPALPRQDLLLEAGDSHAQLLVLRFQARHLRFQVRELTIGNLFIWVMDACSKDGSAGFAKAGLACRLAHRRGKHGW